MNIKRLFTGFIILLLILTAFSAAAMGNRDAGKPEPVEMKSATDESAAKQVNDPDYPPEGWVTDIREAYKIAQAEDKQILINFTGSDWCVWCKKLSKEVFTTPEFKTYADENLVLLFLDFPNTINLPKTQTDHNFMIAQLLGVQGYPSIWLLDGDLSPIMATGYRDGGSSEYIRHLSEDRPDIDPAEREDFRKGFTQAIETNIGELN